MVGRRDLADEVERSAIRAGHANQVFEKDLDHLNGGGVFHVRHGVEFQHIAGQRSC